MRHERALRRMGRVLRARVPQGAHGRIRALCDVVLDRDDAGEDARELAEGVLYELEGGDA